VRITLVAVAAAIFYLYKRWRNKIDKLLEESAVSLYADADGKVRKLGMGMLVEMTKNFHRAYDSKIERLTRFGRTYLSPPPIIDLQLRSVIVSSDPEIVKYILKDNFNNFVKRGRIETILRDLIGEGIFTADHDPRSKDSGKNWYFQRKTASRIFTRNVFNNFVRDSLLKNCDKLIHRLDGIAANGESIDMQNIMFKFTMDTIGLVGFGIDLKTLEKDNVPFAKAFDQAQKLITTRFLRPGWDSPFGKLLYKEERDIEKSISILDAFCKAVIEERRDDKDLESKGDIISLFMQADGAMSDKMLRDVVMSFFIAGRDTTACTLSFALLILAQNPNIQDKLYMELNETFGSRKDKNFTTKDMDRCNLPYLHGVVFESLRMFPPVPVDLKTCAQDDVLPNGQKVYAGDTVTFEPYAMGRMNWEDADIPQPERWADPSKDPTQYEFPVFQAGPRICLGKDFAVFEAKCVLTTLIQRYRFTLAKEIPEIPYSPGITLTVNGGLHLNLEKR